MPSLDYQLFYTKQLPHIQPPGATFFITYRLANSIPKAVQIALMDEWETITKHWHSVTDTKERQQGLSEARRRMFGRWDAVLDKPKSGPRWLCETAVAAIVMENLHHFDGKLYKLDCFCLMCNHIHVVLTPLETEEGVVALPRIMHALKGYTAVQANRILKRKGAFWQAESFDHIVRDEKALDRIRTYVINNPVNAGLVDDVEAWPFSYAHWL